MKKHIIILAVFVLSMVFHSSVYAEFSSMKEEKEHGHHKLIDCEKVEQLKEEGYAKEDIFMAAMLAKKTDKKVEDVLALYKEQKSWKKTAAELGIDEDDLEKMESIHEWKKFVKENKDEVILYLADYSEKKPEEIKAYLDDDISLRFLIGAAALAKVSDKKLDEIIAYKKDGKSFHDMMEMLDVDDDDLHNELKNFKSEVQEKVKKE